MNIMKKQFKKIFLLIPFFILSCTSNKYLKDYEPIKIFLTQERIDTSKTYILQAEKVDNQIVLADFKEFKSAGPYFDSNFEPIAFHNDKQYEKMCSKYLNDTLKRYWKKDEFLNYKLIIKKRKDIISNSIDNYSPDQFRVYISEPMYYWNRRYLIFSYGFYNNDGGITNLIFMKKQKGKWKVDKISSSEVYF